MLLVLLKVVLQLLLYVFDVGRTQHPVLQEVATGRLKVVQGLLVLPHVDQRQSQVDKAQRVDRLVLQTLTVVVDGLGVVFGQPVDVSKGVVGAVVCGVDPNALLEVVDSVDHVVLVVVGYSQPVVGVVIVGTDLDAAPVPDDGLIEVAQLVVDASQPVVGVFVLPIHLNALLIAVYRILIVLLVIEGVPQSVVGPSILWHLLDESLQLSHSQVQISVAQCSHQLTVTVLGLQSQALPRPFSGLPVSIPLQTVNKGDPHEGLLARGVQLGSPFISHLRLFKFLLIVLEVGQSHCCSETVGSPFYEAHVPLFVGLIVLSLAETERKQVMGRTLLALLLLLHLGPLPERPIVVADAVFEAAQSDKLVLQVRRLLDTQFEQVHGLLNAVFLHALFCTFPEGLSFWLGGAREVCYIVMEFSQEGRLAVRYP